LDSSSKHSTFIPCQLLAATIHAQSYIPTIVKGRTWEITKPMGLGQFSNYSITLACDTQINSLNYLKVNSYNTNDFIVREDTISHKLYYYDKVLGVDKLFLDYDISLGSTFNGMVVDSINYATYFGQNRKVIYFNNLVKWIEGAGSSFNGLSDTMNGYTYVTNVFSSDTSCFPLTISEIELNNVEVKRMGSIIHFYSSMKSPILLRLYNSTGQLFKQLTFNNTVTIDLANYSRQLIFIEIISDRKRSVRRLFTY
jgi:hypothetical protein